MCRYLLRNPESEMTASKVSEANTKIISAVYDTVRERMQGQGAGHDFEHVLRVLKNADAIHAAEGGDWYVIALAALLHDLGDAKFWDGQERSGEFASEILSGLSVCVEVVHHVVEIVENLSFRKRGSAKPMSLEGRIVQDADRLDALGAIGIVRTVEYGAAINQPFYSSDPNRKS
ncbi:MAG: HD domain-containing protein, partial [Planctomycetota bacterium]